MTTSISMSHEVSYAATDTDRLPRRVNRGGVPCSRPTLCQLAGKRTDLFQLGRGLHAVARLHAADGDDALVLPLAVGAGGLVHGDRRVVHALAVAVEQKRRLGKREAGGTEGVQAVDGSLLLRRDIEPIDRRREDDHVGTLERLDHAGHVVLLHAGALMGEAVLAAQTTGDLLVGDAHDLDRVATLARGLGKGVDHGVGVGALARAAAQNNDIHRILPSWVPQARGTFFVVTKTDGAIQSPANHISYSSSLDTISLAVYSPAALILSPKIEQHIIARKVSAVGKLI